MNSVYFWIALAQFWVLTLFLTYRAAHHFAQKEFHARLSTIDGAMSVLTLWAGKVFSDEHKRKLTDLRARLGDGSGSGGNPVAKKET